MCVALVKPAGLTLDRETLELCFKQNPDGCGFAFVNENNEIKIFKSMDFDSFILEYEAVQERYLDRPFLIHFRIKTHGTKDLFNCHPFRINEDMAFIHNGIIKNIDDCPDKIKSDTQMFNELVLKKLPKKWFDNEGCKKLIEQYIDYSKIAVLHRRNGGEVKIYNESKGTWVDGVWFSNTLWQPRKTYTYTHADKCLQCNNWIKNNAYANKNNVSYCSEKCKETFLSRGYYSNRPECYICGSKYAYFSVYLDHNVEYHYCSTTCKNKHEQARQSKSKEWECKNCGKDITYVPTGDYCNETCMREHLAKESKQKQLPFKDSKNQTFVVCTWCDEVKSEDEMVEVAEYCAPYNVDACCVHCLEDAIAAQQIISTPEIEKVIEEVYAKLNLERKIANA